jgi:tRNA threonylcarbamoyladenosine biosynthesis protein TsaE
MAYNAVFDEIMECSSFNIESLDQTTAIGRFLGAKAQPGFVYCLDGDLGAGKTTLTQAIAAGLKLDDGNYISSPSFAIMHEYPGDIPLYHMDFYRLHDADDVVALGFDEYFYKQGLTVIEWSKRAPEILPEQMLSITITLTHNSRTLKICATSQYLPLLKDIQAQFALK